MPRKVVVDLGCSTGRFAIRFATDYQCTVYMAEIDPVYASWAREYAKLLEAQLQEPLDVTVAVGDVLKERIYQRSEVRNADLVVCNWADWIRRIVSEKERCAVFSAVEDIAKHMKVGGIIVTSLAWPMARPPMDPNVYWVGEHMFHIRTAAFNWEDETKNNFTWYVLTKKN